MVKNRFVEGKKIWVFFTINKTVEIERGLHTDAGITTGGFAK